MPYQITEPHPTTLPNHYVHTGRGGAGNTFKPSSSSTKPSPLHATTSNTSSFYSNGKFSAGRGGAGNIHPSSEAPSPFSFEDEVDLQSAREKNHKVYHVGRGGAGNWTTRRSSKELKERKLSNDSWESSNSSGSAKSGFLGRLSNAFERR